MIYQVNWISKDKNNVTTTTDVTNYTTIGFTNVEKLGEEMDIGSIELRNTTRDTPYPIWDIIQVNIYNDVTEEYEEVISMRIAGDKISLSSKNPKRYTHNITLVEHTKLLELFVVSGKTFTNPTDGTTGYSIADVVETLFKVTPLEITKLIRVAFATNSQIVVTDNVEHQFNETFNTPVESSITVLDDYIHYQNYSLSLSITSSINATDDVEHYLNVTFALPITSDVTVSDDVYNYINESASYTVNSSVVVNDVIVSQHNETFSNTITSNVVVDDDVISQSNETYSQSISGTLSVLDDIYINRPVEWVLGGTSVTANQTCDEEADVGNVKSETIGECSFDEDGVSYSSTTDLTTSIPTCSEGATYTLCIGSKPNYTCQDYIGVDTREEVYYTCELKT